MKEAVFIHVALLALGASGCVAPIVAVPASSRGRGGVMFHEAPERTRCDRHIDVLGAIPPGREVLREISASCDVGLPRDCEEILILRACELGASAIVIADEGSTAPQPRALGNVLLRTRSASALR